MKISFKEMLSEFKAFAFKGNLIDLAVAVVIGTAFSGVIKALVDDIIMPTVSYAVSAASTAAEAGKKAAEHVGDAVGVTSKPSTAQSTTQPSTQASATQPATQPSTAPPPVPVIVEVKSGDKPPEKAVNFEWTIGRIKIGHFIGELLNFIIIAFAVFIIVVKMLGSVMKRVGSTPPPSEPTTKECPKCLSLIPIKATKCAHCTADL